MPAFDDKTHRRYGKLVVLELSSTKYRNKSYNGFASVIVVI